LALRAASPPPAGVLELNTKVAPGRPVGPDAVVAGRRAAPPCPSGADAHLPNRVGDRFKLGRRHRRGGRLPPRAGTRTTSGALSHAPVGPQGHSRCGPVGPTGTDLVSLWPTRTEWFRPGGATGDIPGHGVGHGDGNVVRQWPPISLATGHACVVWQSTAALRVKHATRSESRSGWSGRREGPGGLPAATGPRRGRPPRTGRPCPISASVRPGPGG